MLLTCSLAPDISQLHAATNCEHLAGAEDESRHRRHGAQQRGSDSRLAAPGAATILDEHRQNLRQPLSSSTRPGMIRDRRHGQSLAGSLTSADDCDGDGWHVPALSQPLFLICDVVVPCYTTLLLLVASRRLNPGAGSVWAAATLFLPSRCASFHKQTCFDAGPRRRLAKSPP